jgi:hypothetical protein
MSEEKLEMPLEEESQAPAEESEDTSAESEASKANVADELQQLGRNLAAATKAVLESPEAKEFASQLQRGLRALDKSVHELADQARDTTVGQKVETSVGDAATAVKDRHVLDTLAGTVAAALHTVNQTLGQAVEKAQSRTEGSEQPSGPQQIEVVEDEEE